MPTPTNGVWRWISGLLATGMLSAGGAVMVVGSGKADKVDVESLNGKVEQIQETQKEFAVEIGKIQTRQEAIKEDTQEIKEILRGMP